MLSAIYGKLSYNARAFFYFFYFFQLFYYLSNNLEIGHRFKDEILNKYKSLSEFGRVINVRPQDLNYYLNGKIGLSSFKFQNKIKEAGLDLDYILYGKKEDETYHIADASDMIKEPENVYNQSEYSLDISGFIDLLVIKGVVSAGYGAFAEDRTKLVKYPKSFLKGIRKPAMISVSGDSMSPIIEDGDSLIFEQVNTAKNGNTIICTYNDICYVKKFIQTPKHLCLRSLNNKFEDIDISMDKIVIHGVVKKIIKNL